MPYTPTCPICDSVLENMKPYQNAYSCAKCNYHTFFDKDMLMHTFDHMEYILLGKYVVENHFVNSNIIVNKCLIFYVEDRSKDHIGNQLCELDFHLNFKNLTEEKLKSYLMLI